METCPREEVVKEEKFTNTRKPSGLRVCGNFGSSEGNITGRGKKKTPQNMCLTATPNGEVAQTLARSSPDTRICNQQAGAEQGGVGCIA